jgi:hypothetical protein
MEMPKTPGELLTRFTEHLITFLAMMQDTECMPIYKNKHSISRIDRWLKEIDSSDALLKLFHIFYDAKRKYLFGKY